MKKTIIIVLLTLVPTIAHARLNNNRRLHLVEKADGPRIGMTALAGNPYHEALSKDITPVFSQFGWQFETRFAANEDITGLIEWVPLIGGMEQGLFIPSFSALIGLRIRQGFDIAVGPNISITDPEDPSKWLSLVFAVGQTIKTKSFSFPIHLAVVPKKDGARISLLTGFSWR